MLELILGPNGTEKNELVVRLRDHHLKSSLSSPSRFTDALRFDFTVLHGRRLHPDDLKQAVISFPVIAKARVVLVHDAQQLDSKCEEVILRLIDQGLGKTVLILEAEKEDKRTKFWKTVIKAGHLQRMKEQEVENVFDMTKAISAGRNRDAIRILSALADKGDHPLQILGALVWFWGKMKGRVAGEIHKKGLLELQEADFQIKRSRMRQEYVLEILVTKLCVLISPEGKDVTFSR